MLKLALITCCLLALGGAYPAPWWGWGPWGLRPEYAPYWSDTYRPRAAPSAYTSHAAKYEFSFLGKYPGSCAAGGGDGVYYVDAGRFAYCTGGQAVLQACADGSANPPLTHYNGGRSYTLAHFCSVNLVAQGYHKKPRPSPTYAAPPVEGQGDSYNGEDKVHTDRSGSDKEDRDSDSTYKNKVMGEDGNYRDFAQTKEYTYRMEKKPY